MAVNIGLNAEQRAAAAKILNRVLADTFVVYAKTRGFHWNVTGSRFMELHRLFESQYEALAESIDEIAERTRALGVRATGSLAGFLAEATLRETTGDPISDDRMLAELRDDHEAMARSLRKDVATVDSLGDEGTTDFLTGLLQTHEKTAWMLRSYVAS